MINYDDFLENIKNEINIINSKIDKLKDKQDIIQKNTFSNKLSLISLLSIGFIIVNLFIINIIINKLPLIMCELIVYLIPISFALVTQKIIYYKKGYNKITKTSNNKLEEENIKLQLEIIKTKIYIKILKNIYEKISSTKDLINLKNKFNNYENTMLKTDKLEKEMKTLDEITTNIFISENYEKENKLNFTSNIAIKGTCFVIMNQMFIAILNDFVLNNSFYIISMILSLFVYGLGLVIDKKDKINKNKITDKFKTNEYCDEEELKRQMLRIEELKIQLEFQKNIKNNKEEIKRKYFEKQNKESYTYLNQINEKTLTRIKIKKS